MLTELHSSYLKGEVQAIASKSYVHRLLIAAALSNRPTLIKGRITGEDATATAECLRALGANIIVVTDGYRVEPITKPSKDRILNCGESGSTLRFILPLACALGAECTITGSGRLAARPLVELIDTLTEMGAEIKGDRLPLKIGGQLKSGDYKIPAYISSQYITGLMLALPLLDGDSKLILQGKTVSAPYIDITLDVLKDFGIEIKREKYGYSIKGNQRYRSKGEAAAEGDWSNAAFFLAGGALSGEVTVTGLSPSSKQGDRAVADILEKMGADIAKTSTSITAKKSALKGINLDVRDTPDLVPVLAIAAMYAKGKTVFTGVDRLKDKESDRLSAILETVARLGGHAEYQEGALTVYHGCGKGDVTLSSHNDHRLAMSAAVAAINYQGKIILEGSESVSKSYPAFFCDYKKLGGLADEFQS